MRIAVVGSRTLAKIDLSEYLPTGDFTLVSGGARGVDSIVKKYAEDNGIEICEILPCYEKYGRAAPLVRNKEIVETVDRVIAFWDGRSRGTRYVIDYCKRLEKPCTVVRIGAEA